MPEDQALEKYSPGLVSPFRWRDRLVIPVPKNLMPEQAIPEGLSLEARRALTTEKPSTISETDTPILLLGGDLPESEWGIPQISRAAFNYIREHPWIKILDADDLSSLHPLSQIPAVESGYVSAVDPSEEKVINLLDQITHLPDSVLEQTTWHALFSLYSPIYPAPDQSPALRKEYAGQLITLIDAAIWASSFSSQSECPVDLDSDGHPECLLSSPDFFVVVELETGAMSYFFIRSPSGIHQIIAPSSQLIVGTSDPASWDESKGLGADPSVWIGAFMDNGGPYRPTLLDAGHLTLLGNGVTKTYHLSAKDIQVDYSTTQEITTQIPLILDPWNRFLPGWSERYSLSQTSNGWLWKLDSGPGVEVRTDAEMEIHYFAETRALMSTTEDPNRDYPAGHFLPFPLAILTLRAPRSFSASLSVVLP
jgi:hypothetical protein